MKVIRHDGSDERHASTSLVFNKDVLAAVSADWAKDTFASKYANILAGWCIAYFAKYKDAPGASGIQAHFDTWKVTANEDVAQTMADWLASLPSESNISTEYAVDMIRKIAQTNSLRDLGNKILASVEKGSVEDALNLQSAWKRPKLGQETYGVFPLQDLGVIKQAFSYAQSEPLISYPGPLGQFINPVMVKDAFVCFLAPEKTGKTTVLTDAVCRAVTQGRRVAYFSCGDMSQDQIILRMTPRMCNRPLKGGSFRIPKELTYENKEPKLKHEVHTAPPITSEDATQAFARWANNDPTRFRLLTHPAGSLKASDISNMALRWADEGWLPEVFVIDYADILGAPAGLKEKRDQIDETWRELRALSTSMRALVLTASQSDTEGYSAWLLSKRNFSDSKTKVAHVTAMIGLNMTDAERRQGVCRYNYVALREAEFMQDHPSYVGVAGCTKVGRPSMISAWPTD